LVLRGADRLNGHPVVAGHQHLQAKFGTLVFDFVVHLRPAPTRRWAALAEWLH
jgi:hypothetical protein